MDYLATHLSKHRVDIIVVGDPRGLDGRPTDATAGADGFAKALQNRFPNVRVERYNEMFTSKMASRAIAQSGLPKHKRQEKGLTDRVSAVLILQGFMEKTK
jgi:putative holliday junction resolvase